MRNVLSVDVEDYFHVEAFSSRIDPESWPSFQPRVQENIAKTLELFHKHDVKATFFILGWVAEHFPQIAGDIASAGHEIGCHGSRHQRIHRQNPEEFRRDVRTARQCLQKQTGQTVDVYRAPSFSIVPTTLWALDILAEEGFKIDSSIFPVRHDLYGIPDANRSPHWQVTRNGNEIFEFPPSTIRIVNHNLGMGGGGYLRFIPYALTHWAIRRINEREQQPVMVYFHPWELDPGQPRIQAPFRSRLRHYTNLSVMHAKLDRLLKDFAFAPLTEICQTLDVYRNPAGSQTFL